MKDIKRAKASFNVMMRLPVQDQQLRQYYCLNNQGFIAQTAGDYAMAEYYYKETYAFCKGA